MLLTAGRFGMVGGDLRLDLITLILIENANKKCKHKNTKIKWL